MSFCAITAMRYCLPKTELTHEDLLQNFEEKHILSIEKMSGIKNRRVVTKDITSVDLAYCAAKRLFVEKNIDPQSIDLIVFASQTGDYQVPASASVLHQRLKLSERAAAFDVGMGCSSFPYGLSIVNGFFATGTVKRVLLINADTITKIIHPLDRGLVTLHGDGACVTLLEKSDGKNGIIGTFLGGDGNGYKHIIMPASGARNPRTVETAKERTDESGNISTDEHLQMNGAAIFHFSIYKVPEVIETSMKEFGVDVNSVDLFLLHQANRMMVDQIYRKLKIPTEKQFYFSENIGNLSGASSPVLLAEAWRQGKIKPGSRTLLAAFGVGLSWGVVLIQWPKDLSEASMGTIDYETDAI